MFSTFAKTLIFLTLTFSSTRSVLPTQSNKLDALIPKSNKPLGTTAFILSGAFDISQSTHPGSNSPNFHNRLFFELAKNKKAEELEVVDLFVRTYTKDVNNKCRMAVKQRYPENDYNRVFLSVYCKLWTQVIQIRMPMNPLFFNVEFALKTFYLLNQQQIEGTYLNEHDAEREVDRHYAEVFFDIMQEELNTAVAGGKLNLEGVSGRFGAIQRFYGPTFKKVFSNILDQNLDLKRKSVVLSKEDQRVFDELLKIDQSDIKEEVERISKKEDIDLYKKDGAKTGYQNIYRYYGKYFQTPLSDVAETFVFGTSAAK